MRFARAGHPRHADRTDRIGQGVVVVHPLRTVRLLGGIEPVFHLVARDAVVGIIDGIFARELVPEHDRDVAERLVHDVRVAVDAEFVRAGIQLVALVAVAVPVLEVVGRHVLHIHFEGERVALAGGEQLGLCKGAEHFVRLFDLPVIIGSMVIQLHDVLARLVARVLHGHLEGDLARRDIAKIGPRREARGDFRHGKIGIAHAVAEGEHDVFLVPCVRSRLAVGCDHVGIHRLIIAVVDVDPLLVLHELLELHPFERLARLCVAELIIGGLPVRGGLGIVAEVEPGRVLREVGIPGVDEMPARVHFAV